MAHPVVVTKNSDEVWFFLSNKPEFLIVMDTEDYFIHVQGKKCWYVHRNRGPNDKPYIRTSWTKSEGHKHLHREILGIGDWSKDSVGDHIDGNTLNIRKSNLRECTSRENARFFCESEVIYRDICIARIRPEQFPNGYFQAYTGQRFMGAGPTIEIVKSKIDQRLDAKEQK